MKYLFLGVIALSQLPLTAQISNTSLTGRYYVRQLNARGAKSAQGIVTFDGAGKFAFQGTRLPGIPAPIETVTVSGDYNLTSSGLLSMKSLINNDILHGGFVNNLVFASGLVPTHGLLVAIPVSQASSNATLTGNYRFVSLDFLDGTFTKARNASFTATANGQGSLGNLTVSGQAANLNTLQTTQAINGATYNLGATGSGTLTLPPSGSADSLLLNGNKTLYVSADGNFILGGSADTYDMILGVRALPGAPSASTFQGLYYFGGVELATTTNNTTGALVDGSGVSFFGSLKAAGTGSSLSHYLQLDNFLGLVNYTGSSSNSTLSADGVLEKSVYRYIFGLNGQVFLGVGTNNNYEIDLGVRVPPFSGTGVFLNPAGIVNGASFAPNTNPIAPGEFISLFGTNLASQTIVAGALPFPETLSGVQVTINGTPAPIYFVSPGQISAVVPYSLNLANRAKVQVINNGVSSNIVEMEPTVTSPGIFSLPPGGSGTGAILRQDFSVVSSSNPAKKGETIQIFLTGLGTVKPAIPAGAAAPSNPLSKVENDVFVFIGGKLAPVLYSGLAPGLAGLYQINATIPVTVASGNLDVQIVTEDADHLQVTVPVQ